MMGRSHALTGWCAGALTGQAVGLPPVAAAAFALVTTGAACLNDLDHDDSAATRSLGPFSRLVAECVQFLSRLTFAATRGPGDPPGGGEHRYATHSLVMLVPIAAAVWALPWLATSTVWVVLRLTPLDSPALLHWAPPATAAAMITFCVAVAYNRLGVIVPLVAVPVGVLLVLGREVDDALTSVWPWLVVAVVLGAVVHVFGDLVTEYGVPLFAPLYRRGSGQQQERWVRIQLPSLLAFRAGGPLENLIVYPALWVAAVLVTPGLWGAVLHVGRAVQAM
jgi:membrane-bound metal-dependent hydrolase YbcI (DUF457 family)